MGSIAITTFNVRGGRDPLKRHRIKSFCKSHKITVANLQETHCLGEAEAKIWADEWNREEPRVWKNETSEFVSNNYTSRSRGTMCIMDKSKVSIARSKCLFEGRVILSLLKLEDFDIDNVILVNVYAPNSKKDRAIFLRSSYKRQKIGRICTNVETLS